VETFWRKRADVTTRSRARQQEIVIVQAFVLRGSPLIHRLDKFVLTDK
jgi:hypothetical protein